MVCSPSAGGWPLKLRDVMKHCFRPILHVCCREGNTLLQRLRAAYGIEVHVGKHILTVSARSQSKRMSYALRREFKKSAVHRTTCLLTLPSAVTYTQLVRGPSLSLTKCACNKPAMCAVLRRCVLGRRSACLQSSQAGRPSSGTPASLAPWASAPASLMFLAVSWLGNRARRVG